MSDEEPTLKNLGKELLNPGYWGRARERQRASKTIWDLIFLPIGFAAMGAYWYAFSKLFLWLHLLIYPADVTRVTTLTRDGAATDRKAPRPRWGRTATDTLYGGVHATLSISSSRMVSKGKAMPSSVLRRMPAFNSAVTSPCTARASRAARCRGRNGPAPRPI